ncbi:MAG TPA: glutamate 5-kinase [Spirochaetia bacterium]|nr:glutamate 5-kinase [Spirochaetia bacterium]
MTTAAPTPDRTVLRQARRIVIKVGTAVATEPDHAFSSGVMGALVRQVAALKAAQSDRSFLLVSSGAIALGLNRLKMASRPKELDLLQAAAAVGQSRLMHAYEHEFEAVSTETAQILLTSEDIRSRTRYLNIRNTIFSLWSFGAVPIVNENDTVSFDEIRFGDNDVISAHIASMLDADLLVILTDTDGVYDRNPHRHAGARILRTVEKVTPAILSGAQGKGSAFSSGGMESKIRAADIATRTGVGVVVARGEGLDLPGILEGREIGTWFVPTPRRMKGRKKWMAFNPRTEGAIIVDRGAERALLKQGRSLLPAGIKAIRGQFEMGSVVSIQDEDGREVARGLTNFGSEDLERIRGLNTKKIPEVLGEETYFDEVVHRDNLVITAKDTA